jgi:hypothetical protein
MQHFTVKNFNDENHLIVSDFPDRALVLANNFGFGSEVIANATYCFRNPFELECTRLLPAIPK